MQIRLAPDVEKMLAKQLPRSRKTGQFNGRRGSISMLANGILWDALRKLLK